jgi:hypothetical protein
MADFFKSQSLPAPDLKSSYLMGAEACEVWIEMILRAIGREHASLVQKMVMEIFMNNRLYDIVWKTTAIVAAENPQRTPELLIEILAGANVESMKESRQSPAATTSTYAWIYKSFGKDSLDVLLVDPIFMANDLGARCPLVAFRRFSATHITERDGVGDATLVSTVNDLLTKFSQLAQLPTEHISDYYQRYRRIQKSLTARHIDPNTWLDTGKKHAIKFSQACAKPDTRSSSGIWRTT